MNHIALPGCGLEPLASYLSALGILGIADRFHPDAALGWDGDTAVLSAERLDRDALERLLLDDYEPSPIVSPWNAGGGFRQNGKSPAAEAAIKAIARSRAPRLEAYRRTVAAARSIAGRYLDDETFKSAKDAIVIEARSELPDEALSWIDAAVVATPDGLRFPDILGTGGNLGRIDLSSNFQQRLLDLVDPVTGDATERSQGWLRDALDGSARRPRIKATVGQYEPGSAGGVNTSTTDGGDAFVNPWRFVLAVEGLTFFASAVSRRLDARGRVASPFAVRAVTVASRHLTEGEGAKDHIYVPAWRSPATAAEVRRLFGEGRLSWGNGQASTSLDASRAIASLGVDRGLTGFQRFAIVERLGQNTLAVPAGSITVGDGPHVRLTRRLDAWVGRVRRIPRAPGTLAEALRVYDSTLLDLAESSATELAPAGLAFLTALADVERVVRRNGALRAEVRPLPRLPASGWLELLDDGTPEFELAVGWASLSDLGGRCSRAALKDVQAIEKRSAWRGSVPAHIRGVLTGGAWPDWNIRVDPEAHVERDGPRALAAVHATHATYAERFQPELQAAIGGLNTGFCLGMPVALASVEAYLAGRLDRERIARTMRALALLGYDLDRAAVRRWASSQRALPSTPDPLYRCLAPLVLGAPVRPGAATTEIRLTADRSWPRRLRDGLDLTGIAREAVTRYRASRLSPLYTGHVGMQAGAPGGDRGSALSAALLLHLRRADLDALTRPATTRSSTEEVVPT